MCGLVGMAGKLEYKDESAMKRLLLLDFLRGQDSTGLAVLRNNGELLLHKMATHPIDFFDSSAVKTMLTGMSSSVFLGHNRAATHGSVNGANAHPFTFGHITGAHNGTLDVSSWLELEELCGQKFDVDSAAIFAAIASHGIAEVVPLLKGAWALTWIDEKEGTINFLRNKARPLWFSWSDKFTRLMWASEWPMMEAAYDMSPQKYEKYISPENYTYYQFAEDFHYSYDIEEIRAGGTMKPTAKMVARKGKEPTPAVTYTCGVSPFPEKKTTSSLGTQSGTKTGYNTGTLEVTKIAKTVSFKGTSFDPYKGILPVGEFTRLTSSGCGYCQKPISYGDLGITLYTKEGMALCKDCSNHGNDVHIYTKELPAHLAQ